MKATKSTVAGCMVKEAIFGALSHLTSEQMVNRAHNTRARYYKGGLAVV